jgi:RND family efflux transporter MFP subunit
LPFYTKFRGSIVLSLLFLIAIFHLTSPEISAQPKDPPPTPVKVEPVERKSASPPLELVGTANANRLSRVAAEVGGKVKAVLFSVGDRVEAGDVLVELDKTALEIDIRAVEARLAGAKVRLNEARSDLRRSRSLRAAKTIAAQAYEKDQFRVQSLEKELLASEAEVAQIRDRLARMTIVAPFSGYIVEQHTEVGQWLNMGVPVATLIDLSLIKVQVPLPERYVSRIQEGAAAKVKFDALNGESFEGRVTALIPLAEQNTRNLPLEVTLPNPDGRIKAGLLARVSVTTEGRTALFVPKDALVLNEGKATVFVIQEDKVIPFSVQTGAAVGNMIEVMDHLEEGQLVVIQGNERLRPNQKVRVIPADKKGARPNTPQ